MSKYTRRGQEEVEFQAHCNRRLPDVLADLDRQRANGTDPSTLIGVIANKTAIARQPVAGVMPREKILPVVLPMLRQLGDDGKRMALMIETSRPDYLAVLCAQGERYGVVSVPLGPLLKPAEVREGAEGYELSVMGALKMVYATDLQDVKPEGRARIERFKARVEAQRVAGAMSGADPGIEGALRALLDVDQLQAALARGGVGAMLELALDGPPQA